VILLDDVGAENLAGIFHDERLRGDLDPLAPGLVFRDLRVERESPRIL
jgi:hypothetical protein